MLRPETEAGLREWILADMASAPPRVALSAMTNMLGQFVTGEAAKIFAEVRVPVVSVNGYLWPIAHEANRRHMASYDAIVVPVGDHFLQLAMPEAFNRALEQAIGMVVAKDGEAAAAAPAAD